MARQTPAARALVGCLALRGDTTIKRSFELAGYKLTPKYPAAHAAPWYERSQLADVRVVTRNGRVVKTTANAGCAVEWLTRLGRKLEALSVGTRCEKCGGSGQVPWGKRRGRVHRVVCVACNGSGRPARTSPRSSGAIFAAGET